MGPSFVIIGTSLIIMATLLYWYEEGFMAFVTPERATYFALLAYTYLGVLMIGGILTVLGLRRFVTGKVKSMEVQGYTPLTPSWILPYVLSQKRFRRYFLWSASLYGLFFALVTSVIVYQPTVDFTQAYHAVLPSVLIGPCCGPPLYAPVLTVYLVNHLGLLIIPLTVILLLVVSVLVGLNFALATFAFSYRARRAGRGWVAGLGALVGLFTGCPTCAGVFFASFVGGAGAVSLVALLSYYQPVFVALSVPILLGTPYLISRSLSQVVKEGCIFLDVRSRTTAGP